MNFGHGEVETVGYSCRPDMGFAVSLSRLRANAWLTNQRYVIAGPLSNNFQNTVAKHLLIRSLPAIVYFLRSSYTMRPLIPSLFALACIIPSVLTTPYDSAALPPRNIDSTDLRAPTDSSCWQALNLRLGSPTGIRPLQRVPKVRTEQIAAYLVKPGTNASCDSLMDLLEASVQRLRRKLARGINI